MAKRQVTQTKKDKDGDILALCNPRQIWSPVSKSKAISEIEKKINAYFVKINNDEVNIYVAKKSDGSKYLKTEPDTNKENNLDNLPDC